MPVVSLIAALDRSNAIGRHGALPWHLPDDLKHFKALTLGKPVLMGRKTADALGRALPGRQNWVLTRSGHAPFAGMHAVAMLEDALQRAAEMDAPELCVIGGGEVYALAFDHAHTLHLTHVHTRVEDADAFFPACDPARWHRLSCVHHPADARHAHAFDICEYRRVD